MILVPLADSEEAKMSHNLHQAEKDFEAALANAKVNDAVIIELIRGLVEVTKYLEAADNKLEQILSNTA